MTDTPMLNRKQAAQLLNISIRTLDRHRQLGRIRYHNLALGGCKPLIRFDPNDLAAFAALMRIDTEPSAQDDAA